MDNYYDKISSSYPELHKQEQIRKIKIVTAEIAPLPDDKLLNIGCGPFFSSEFFNCKKYGIDPSEDLLKIAKNCETKVGIAEYIPYPDDFFDYIISFTALHHAKDVDKALSEINRVAKKDAVIALSLLKKGKNTQEFIEKASKLFKTEKEIDEEKDEIIIMTLI